MTCTQARWWRRQEQINKNNEKKFEGDYTIKNSFVQAIRIFLWESVVGTKCLMSHNIIYAKIINMSCEKC